MGGTWSRIKSWATGETLTASDLNAEFNNVISNATPTGTDDHSSTTGQMDSTSDPYPGSSQTQATSLAGELEQLRYVIDEMHGGAKWYISRELLALAGGTMTGAIVLPAGSAAAPAIGWTNTGLYEVSADDMGVAINGSRVLGINSSGLITNTADGPTILDTTASATVPTLVPNRSDLDTGWGWATDKLHAIVNGSDVGYFDSTGWVGSVSSIFGAWDLGTKSKDTNYQAATDVLVIVYWTPPGTSLHTVTGITDSGGTPSQVVAKATTDGQASAFVHMMFPVKKDDYYKVSDVTTGATVTINVMPIGS
jgi:hypothetical protein